MLDGSRLEVCLGFLRLFTYRAKIREVGIDPVLLVGVQGVASDVGIARFWSAKEYV